MTDGTLAFFLAEKMSLQSFAALYNMIIPFVCAKYSSKDFRNPISTSETCTGDNVRFAEVFCYSEYSINFLIPYLAKIVKLPPKE